MVKLYTFTDGTTIDLEKLYYVGCIEDHEYSDGDIVTCFNMCFIGGKEHEHEKCNDKNYVGLEREALIKAWKEYAKGR